MVCNPTWWETRLEALETVCCLKNTPSPQVEERLRFYEEGVAPTKNLTAMQEVLTALGGEDKGEDKKEGKKKKKKRSAEEVRVASSGIGLAVC